MASEMLTKWLSYYDPIHRGNTQRGIANGMTATLGWAYPRVLGGYNLYRGVDGAAVDDSLPVGAADSDAKSISNFSWRGHAVSTDYAYEIRSVGGGGVESASAGTVPVTTDGAGVPVGARPNRAAHLRVRPSVGGSFHLRWTYDARGQVGIVSLFAVYNDGGTGAVDWNTPFGLVPYRVGKTDYSLTTSAFAQGTRRVWGVRAVTSGGVHDGNTDAVFGWADAVSPDAHPSVVVTCVDEPESI
jgi:hypothetical protein